MAEKRVNGRIINKHATEAEWLLHPDFIPEKAELIVYDIDATHPHERIKMGDGKTPINDLPFIGSDLQIGETQPAFACSWFKVKS